MPPFHVQNVIAFAIEVARLTAWLLVLAVIFLPLERLFALNPQRIFRKSIAVDLCYYFLSSLLPGLLLAAPLSVIALAAHRVMPGEIQDAVSHAPFWARAGISFLIGEVGFYWGHRWSHEIPFLWRCHAIHHSASHLDFMVHTRAHPVDIMFTRLTGLIPLYVLGLAGPSSQSGSVMALLVTVVAALWGFFIHSNIRWRLGPLEWLIATPAFHHWHHTRAEPWNKNYASTLPWLDRVFGTHHLPRREWPTGYGIHTPVPDTLAGQLAHPWRRQVLPETSAVSSSQVRA